MVSLIFCALIFVGQMGRPSSLVKAGWIVLTSLLESKNADTGFFPKLMGWQMHGTRTRLAPRFLPTRSSLATVIGVEVAETVTSFLTSLSDFEDIFLSNVLFDSS